MERESYPIGKNEKLIATTPQKLQSHFIEVVVDVSHKTDITLGLLGDEG